MGLIMETASTLDLPEDFVQGAWVEDRFEEKRCIWRMKCMKGRAAKGRRGAVMAERRELRRAVQGRQIDGQGALRLEKPVPLLAERRLVVVSSGVG